MLANYHTHTWRCGHAEGNEKEYAAAAVRAGLKVLGFSDHTPYDFFDAGPRNRPMRMPPEELPGYADSVRRLAEEYRGRLEIRLGVEAEYYPRYFPRLLELLRDNGVEYMILGQHYIGNEISEPYCGRPCADPAVLQRYAAQASEALETGLFAYFAHPDLIYFTGSDAVYEREMRKLCRTARKMNTPLEINLLGIRDGRNYPDERFWRIAGEEKNTVILGCDAHLPEHTADRQSEKKALAMAERFGLQLADEFAIAKKLREGKGLLQNP